MKSICLIIAGGREVSDQGFLDSAVALALASWGDPVVAEVVSGRASGADACGERWAAARGIPVQPFPADWAKFGRAAGGRRNAQMAEYALGGGRFGATGALVAVPHWRSKSRSAGTRDMIQKARALELLVHVCPWGGR